MADSNITKRALATALRELMEEVPFEKIQVALICERCNMNRKSFYYHFKDKYDLLNWIFDTEIISFVKEFSNSQKFEERIEETRSVCNYFYENRNFYRKALKIEGQNSFSEHFREYIIEKGGQERNNRLFIGNSRSSIKHMLKSKAEGKDKWLKEILNNSIWNKLYINYKWRLLPLYPKLFFYLCCKKHINSLFFLCKLK